MQNRSVWAARQDDGKRSIVVRADLSQTIDSEAEQEKRDEYGE